jgi:hypothetical protein
MPNSIKDLKAGDTIFVVQQRRRGDKEDRTSTEVVTRVGTKYAYYEQYNREQPFHRTNGESAHKEWNERVNGFGFDVYLCEEEWRAKVHENEQYALLKKRLMGNWGLKPLPYEAVKRIHEVLDEWVKDGAE